MILTLICFAAFQSAGTTDFFPTTPGTVRSYELKRGGQIITNTIGHPLDAGGVAIVPITESTGGADPKTTYYRVTANDVSVYAYDVAHPLATPMPLLRIGAGKLAWDYQGKTATGAGGEMLREHGEARPGGQRTVLGKKVDVMIVKLACVVGTGLSEAEFEQTTVYGRGFGIVEQTTVQRIGKKSVTESFRLVDFQPGK